MKKLILSLAAIAAVLMPGAAGAANDKGNCNVKGTMQNAPDTLLVFTGPRSTQRDTVLTHAGSFSFSVNVAEPTPIYVYAPGALRNQDNRAFQFIAVPGESCVLSGDLRGHYYVDGSKFYKEYNTAERAMEAAVKPLTDFRKSLDKRMQAGENSEALMREYNEKAPALQEQMLNTMLAFIKANPRSEGSAAVIPQLGDLARMKQAVSLLAPEIRDGRMKSIYQYAINQMEERAKADSISAARQAAGIMAPEFTLNDPSGKPLSLSSLRGKYVVLDFWGTWCIWCVRGIPKMKEYYNKYKGKFEILSIDCNESKEKWLAGIKKYELPWLHVYNPDDSKLLSDYAIQGFPTKILVGPDGKIVKTMVGEDPSFYTFLDEKFGEK